MRNCPGEELDDILVGVCLRAVGVSMGIFAEDGLWWRGWGEKVQIGRCFSRESHVARSDNTCYVLIWLIRFLGDC